MQKNQDIADEIFNPVVHRLYDVFEISKTLAIQSVPIGEYYRVKDTLWDNLAAGLLKYRGQDALKQDIEGNRGSA